MSASSPQPRVHSGTPTGGQFTFSERGESTLTLDAPAETARSWSLESIDEISHDDAVRLTALAEASAKHHTRHTPFLSVEDIRQDTLVATLAALDKGKRIGDVKGFQHTTALKKVADVARQGARSEDVKANKMFEAQVAAIESELDRKLSSKEQDEIARGIVENWHNPKHKPSVDFRFAGKRQVDLPFSAMAGDSDDAGYTGEESFDRLIAGARSTDVPDADEMFVAPGSYMEMALDVLDSNAGERIHRSRLQRYAYNALAERAGAPTVIPGALSSRKCIATRAQMDTYEGGAAAAVNAYNHGRDDAGTEALFAPFGELSEDEKDAVADLIGTNAERAETLWGSAMILANRRIADQMKEFATA